MAKHKKKLPKVVYKSIWSEKMTVEEKKEAQRKLDDIYNFIFQKTFESMKRDQK